SFGLSTMTFYRDVYYENGKWTNSLDNTKEIGTEAYQLYSADRPSDYTTRRYLLNECKIEGDYAILEGTGDIRSFASAEQVTSTVTKKLKDEKGTIAKDKEGNEIQVKTTEIGEKQYIVHDNYLYEDGYYWVNLGSGEAVYMPENMFKNSSYASGLNNTMPYIYYYNGRYYVYGNYNNGEYTFDHSDDNFINYDADKHEYTLKYDDGGDGINAGKIENSTVEHEADVAFKLGSGTNTDGYKVLSNAYYTLGGNTKATTHKVGTFTKTDTPTGTKEVDYHEVEIATIQPVEEHFITAEEYKNNKNKYDIERDNSGRKTYLFNGTAYNLTEAPYYSDDQTELPDGRKIYVKVTGERIAQKYYYQIQSASDTTEMVPEPTYVDGDGNIVESVELNLYPSTFKNPYNGTVSGVQDNRTYVYDSESSESSITVKVKYFLFEGGYRVKDINAGKTDVAPDYAIYTKTTYAVGDEELTVIYKVDDQDKSYQEILDNWSTYGTKSFTVDIGGDKKQIVFNTTLAGVPVKEGSNYIIYLVDSHYALHNGTLCKVSLRQRNVTAKSANADKWELDRNWGIYTRYNYESWQTPLDWKPNEIQYTLKPNGAYNPEFSGNPNPKTTNFAEHAQVVFSGKVYRQKNAREETQAGGIYIYGK
ncbi:MAG: hypothetical protein MJ152_01225, partial [Clostridia bacterium]|nr:hypothetical protein [Clostridia bacterium]